MSLRYLLLLPVILLAIASGYAQEKEASIPLDHFYVERQPVSIFRRLLSKVTFGVSTGYSHTALKHSLDGFGVLQKPDSVPKIFNLGSGNGYSNWINRATPTTLNPAGGTLISSDTADLGFKSKGFAIPLRLTVHVDFKKFRIGGGYSWDFLFLGDFKPISLTNEIAAFKPQQPNFTLKRYWISATVPAYRYYEYLLSGELTLGGYIMGREYRSPAIKRGIAFSLAAVVERDMSEYFKLFVRPSYEIKGYKLALPAEGSELKHRFNAFTIHIGATYRIPELRRCYEKSCRIQMNHAHGNREYRSRVHPIYKKQNPNYGENYPKLIKYKGKNKNKLNPY